MAWAEEDAVKELRVVRPTVAPGGAMRRVAGFAWMCLIGFSLAPDVSADGGLIPTPGEPVYETAQYGLIGFDPRDSTEVLILRAQFRGRTKDFAWIVPIPNLPTLTVEDDQTFIECLQLTAPIYRSRDIGCDRRAGEGEYRPTGGDNVFIHDVGTLGVYSTMIVSATDASTLTDSLAAWGYVTEENRGDVENALAFYIAKRWFFVALKTDENGGGGEYEGSEWYGPLAPIRFTFRSVEAVYPLRISRVSAAAVTPLRLFVFAPHRRIAPPARVEFAKRISAEEVETLRDSFPRLAEFLIPGNFVTRLECDLAPGDMTDDLVLSQDTHDAPYVPIHYSNSLPADGVVLIAAAGWFVVRGRRRRGR
jgi:hypothetical protein